MEKLLPYLVENGKAWVLAQRKRHRKRGEELATSDSEQLRAFFEAETLASLRLRRVGRIENPPFYEELEEAGIPIPIDLTRMEGITFVDTVLLAESKIRDANWRSLIFHECVHVAQYRSLGVEEFLEAYIYGWARNGRAYFSIPLERDAYELQGRFERSPGRPFSVEKELQRRLEMRGRDR